ncbi:MAG: response regulator [FCB group bacterium]|nr:response regulator [FCB group bacterium]
MAHILVVEDDRLNIIIFRKILEKRGGFRVTHSEDVPEILNLCASGEIDLVIMDISLTKSLYEGKLVDGITITKLIREDPASARLPIILATAHAMRGDREKFLEECQADGYITKPITDHDGFIAAVKKLLAVRVTEEES